jgi:hypothetical protein
VLGPACGRAARRRRSRRRHPRHLSTRGQLDDDPVARPDPVREPERSPPPV